MSQFAVYPSLEGRSVFISGGGSGIGAEMVRRFTAQGARTAFIDYDRDASEKLVSELAETGPAPLFVGGDVRDVAAIQDAVRRAADRHGPVTVLINNAGRDDRQSLDHTSVETWDDLIQVNLRHVYFAVQAAVGGMKEAGGGSVVNFSSSSWYRRAAGMTVYAAAKAAVVGLTRTLARELGPDNIRVNAVVPGWTVTERQLQRWLTPEANQALLERQCLKTNIQPADVARMALFLAADDSRMCTGHTYMVDAGVI